MPMLKIPKSAAIGLLASAVGLLIAAPLMFLGSRLWPLLSPIGFVFFWACCIVGAVAFGYYNVRLLRSRYVSLQAKPWRDQVW